MISIFSGYLDRANFVGVPMKMRIEQIYNDFKLICPEPITTMFVSEYMKDNNEMEYEGLWFFSPKFAMEAKNFMTKEDYDILKIRNSIVYCEIIKSNFDIKVAGSGGIAELKATRNNCNYLFRIYRRNILPNLV
jgi:hypothetical protein